MLARKPLVGTVANNVLTHGTGGINIDGCRVQGEPIPINKLEEWLGFGQKVEPKYEQQVNVAGRFPANFIHDGSDEVLELFPSDKPNQSPVRFFYCAKASKKDRNEGLDGFSDKPRPTMGNGIGGQPNQQIANNKNNHPTVKPTDLMRYLCRLVTPPNGTVLDPFTGSGSTGKAAVLEGFNFIGVEQSEEYIAIAQARIQSAKEDR